MVAAVQQGWKRLIVSNWRGGRFAGSGLGATDNNLRIDLYGDVGDYAGSGLDGVEMYIHGSGQDQVGQILKRGKLVLFGDAGQTFLYGAKGGSIFVLGSVAGRPLINAVGKPKAVINGTCLDYLAESFMAGDPLNGGGFVIINGVTHDENGNLVELPTPYPGGNLMSLASGGAIYIRDPKNRIGSDQLNGGQIFVIDDQDWVLINKFLVENERLFGIQIEDLLKVNGDPRTPQEVYKKITPQDSRLLSDA
jgi:glutamate synthase domain-containing protein 3